ncbi:membrane protein [Klebsiella phage K64-1]|uniref:membrane protein n=1 Tax=Klebsiella phage K64-1 TaxID=1439894 RepID=UPI00248BAFD1|nr:membrane protein [Klebsiella phage K64-1]
MMSHCKFWLPVMVVLFIIFTVVNYKIHNSIPRQPTAEELAIHQNSGLYAEVLNKIKNKCTGISDNERNTFYTCQDGSKVSVIYWKRQDRSGYVTRDFDKDGKLISIYGHPDDI